MAIIKLNKNSIEFYRNVPFKDQAAAANFFKKLFPFCFQKFEMDLWFTLWIEMPFIGAKVRIYK